MHQLRRQDCSEACFLSHIGRCRFGQGRDYQGVGDDCLSYLPSGSLIIDLLCPQIFPQVPADRARRTRGEFHLSAACREAEYHSMVRIERGLINSSGTSHLIGPSHRPVIESKEFYKLFPALKRRLDQQVVTHRSAGEFLHLMKTLMAKLKVRVASRRKRYHVLLTGECIPGQRLGRHVS